MSKEIVLNINGDGTIEGIYSDELQEIMGEIEGAVVDTNRVSHVEPGKDGQWYADMSPLKDVMNDECTITEFPKLGPFTLRADALAAEVAWLNKNYIKYK